MDSHVVTETISFDLDVDLVDRAEKALKTIDLGDVARRAFLKAVGDAELRLLQEQKNRELQEHARKLNEELGLA